VFGKFMSAGDVSERDTFADFEAGSPRFQSAIQILRR
jgi:hypothetical protein